MSSPWPKSVGRRLRAPLRRRHGVHCSSRAPRTALMPVDQHPHPMAVVVPPSKLMEFRRLSPVSSSASMARSALRASERESVGLRESPDSGLHAGGAL
jgi:hypothetical protein